MSEARDMVRAYVEAGFAKIHLDASMGCADDRELTEATIAERGADSAQSPRPPAPAATSSMSSAPRFPFRAARRKRSTRWR